jgi:hypothetical protein
LGPFEKICTWQGVTDDDSGPTPLPLSSFAAPATWMVAGPRARSWPFRPTRRVQKLYVPPLSTSVPGPAPPPDTITSP